MKRTILVILNSLTLAGTIAANYLAATGLINGRNVGEISRQYDSLIAPAGYAFVIWSVIYLFLTGFVIYQWVALIRNENRDIIDRTSLFFIISNLANAGWLFLWTGEKFGFSVLVILALIISLIILVYRLGLETWDAPVRIIFFVWWPVAVYFGWIIIATVANMATFLISINWSGAPLSPVTWTVIMISVATLIYLILIYIRNLRESAAVGIWAFIAIAVKQSSDHQTITIAACIAAFILLAAIAYHGYKNHETSPFKKIRRGEF